ncbi:SMC family ATPase [Spirosoma sp. BT702]|uniref:SMC family ATPase n=1 Tax=Spirosoma profusum TaxID=2771354 RepID=A0A926XZ98_9BACT|nr:SMC family ATPase [Spirosoma profusum]MBD2703567.1 SMC family ATPase [Spirosoma profusum]
MIPIKLSIQGLYSYQELQEIDFQRLIGASVFGIFGKVGSGKTSLLEAISFALYGETERLNSRDNRQYNMMNLKSKHLRIDFEFQAGPDQDQYKFIYEAKRHPKKHHEIATGERRMFIRQENDWHPIGTEKEDVGILSKQILGLDYENFKRTIIIPQNQFREFLELSPVERTRMMNQLFKLDQYDLAARAAKLSKVNDDQLAELRGLLSPLANVTPEAIDAAKANLEVIHEQIRSTSGQIAELEPAEQQLLHLQKQHNSLLWAREELTQWLEQEPTFRKIQRDIDQYEQCRLVFQQDFATLDKLQNRRSELAASTKQTQNRLDTITQKLPVLLKAYNTAKDAYENRGLILKQIDELDTVQNIRTVQGSLEQLTRNQLLLEQRSLQQKYQIDQLKADRKNHQSVVDTLAKEESKLEQLYKVQTWFGTYKPLKKQADGLKEQLDQHDTKVALLKQRKDDSLIGFPPEWASLTLKTLPPYIEQELDRLKTIQEQRQSTHQETLLKHELQRYAQNLVDGTPCPLCGSAHHPAKHSNNSNEIDVAKSEELLKNVRQRIDETTTLRLTIKGLEAELRTVLDNGKQLTNERSNVVQQLTTHEDLFVWPEFSVDQEQNVTDAIQQESQSQKQLQDARNAVQECNRQIDDAETSLEQLSDTLTKANTDIAGSKAQLELHVASLQHYKLTDVASWNLSQIDDVREQLDQLFHQTKTDFDEAEKGRSDAEKEQAILQEQIQQLEKQSSSLTDDINIIEKTIAHHLNDNELTREQVEQLLRSNLNVEQEKQRITEYEDKLRSFQKLVADLEVELANQVFDADALTAIQEQLQALRDQKDALNKDLGKAGNIVATLEQQYVDKQAHQKRHDELDLRRQDLKKMDELFRAQGFVNYVSAVYLKNLCESANERFFKLTNNQLKLELDDKNNFLVRDYLNGGEVRSVKTLSGGQTFQAALSLALALSDNIQHLTKAKQNLFFLDEGFGTLDKDSLQTVFKTLKALRSENRVVGIISHVEELQQEVDTYIRAEASENGSRIIGSWEE